jgi:hypothetical protein
MVITGTLDLVERTYEGSMLSSICTHKRQKRHMFILSIDKITLKSKSARQDTELVWTLI